MQKLIAATQNLHQEALLILSSDQQPLYFNERLLQLWSVTPEDLLHAPWARLSQGVLDAAAFVARVGELTLSGQPGLPETFMLKDGRTLEQISYPVTLDDQRSGRVWAWRDITGREALALAQQDSQDLLAKLSAQVPGIIFQYRVYPDGRSCFPYMSDAVSRMYPGITPALIRHDATPFYAFRHPDDAQALSASIRQSADTLSLWDLEYRLVLPEQGVVWRHGHARPERLPDGSTLWSGFITDITERKQTELALRLNASVFDTSGEGILMVGPDNRIVSVNPAFTRITGYSAEEVIGQDPRLLRSGRHSPVFFAALWTAITHSGRWEGELWNRRKNGEVYPQRTAIHTVPGHGQVPDHRIAIFSDISERKRADEHIWRQANYDALTSLPNRRLLLDRLRQEIRKAQRSGEQVALLLVDLDYFKEVNDTLGHDVGDLLLMEAAARLTHCVRSSDTVARLGGDEFMVMLTGRELGHVAEKTALALGQRLGMPFVLDNERAYVSASVGITLYPDDAQDVETLFKNADQAMYAAKKAGRSQHSWFKPSMQELAQQHRVVADRLRQALAAQQFEVYYQPVVELATQRITKAEALLRWHTPGHSPVGPGVFIPIAEELGLINDIGDWAFRQVAAMALHLNQGSDPPVQLAVNKSPRQFRTDNCHSNWSHHLHSIGLDSRHMAIEITEGLLLDSRPETMEKLSELRAQGLQLALDDFGTGYSAMSYLLKFHIDYLKIDQSFVHQVNTPGGQAIVEAMVAMAHKLGLQVIAEGVETPDQLAFLRAIGCDHAQGYLFARPMPAADFERLLQHNRQGQSVWSLPVSH